MNKQRRKELQRAFDLITEAQEIIETCQTEEEDYRDNMHENLQGGEKHERADLAIDSLSEAISSLEEAANSIESAME